MTVSETYGADLWDLPVPSGYALTVKFRAPLRGEDYLRIDGGVACALCEFPPHMKRVMLVAKERA